MFKYQQQKIMPSQKRKTGPVETQQEREGHLVLFWDALKNPWRFRPTYRENYRKRNGIILSADQ
jgi:hypothetical protein